ncbi:MAG TPA: ornithine carbamoyltransferase [Porticoccaceae bacterium]|nr:ornithine carbamoyltransferase [Porticoccaceae bacterium]
MAPRHFLTLGDLSPAELHAVIDNAIALKAAHRAGREPPTMAGRVLGMIFEKSSTRTRVSFESGMAQMGGSAIFLSPTDTQLGRGEPIEDTARVLSRMVDIIMVRTYAHAKLETFAAHSRVPVINALTDDFHPCQVLADIQTFVEHRGAIAGRRVTWIGDGNNMCQSYIEAAGLFDFELRIACPAGYEPNAELLAAAGARVQLGHEPKAAVAGADLVVTDVFTSMGQEAEQQQRATAFAGFQVDHELLAQAATDVLFMHCLPAHRGEEVSAELLEDPRHSVVWDEAENRLHSQKALMRFLLDGC